MQAAIPGEGRGMGTAAPDEGETDARGDCERLTGGDWTGEWMGDDALALELQWELQISTVRTHTRWQGTGSQGNCSNVSPINHRTAPSALAINTDAKSIIRTSRGRTDSFTNQTFGSTERTQQEE
jgi:hypothetical protein